MVTAPETTVADAKREEVNAELIALAPMVGSTVKMKVALNLKTSTRTIETYLKGEGKKLPFAIDLLANLKVELVNAELTAGE